MVSQGVGVDATFIDYNRDGALDLFITNGRGNTVGEYILLKNSGNPNNWLNIDLVGVASNRDGLMARVTVTSSSGTQMRENNGPSHYMSQDSSPLHFGVGRVTAIDQLAITWPISGLQSVANLAVDQTVTVTEGLSLVGGYPGTQDKPGCYAYCTHLGWHLSCIGEADARYDFSGKITSNGTITSVTPLNLEPNDSFQWSGNTITFDLHSRWRNDTIRFSTDGDTVTYDIQQNGLPQPRSVFIGKHKVMPGWLPVELAQ